MGDLILRADAGRLPVGDASVDCVVTSPPYNVGMPYDGVDDARSEPAYRALVHAAAAGLARVLKAGGRAWVNVPYACGASETRMPLAMLWHRSLETAGLRFSDAVVWRQVGANASSETAWGSYLSPNAPNLRGTYELVLLFFKDTWAPGRVGHNDVTPKAWPHLTRTVWEVSEARAKRESHPAPFPEELPRRCILLSTWAGDVVVDPFYGSGTTVRVAKDLGRMGIGCDLSPTYCSSARRRCSQEVLDLAR